MAKAVVPQVEPRQGERVTGVRAAQIVGVDRRTITRWCEKGRFPGAVRQGKPGADWSIPLSAVHALMVEKTSMANAEVLELVTTSCAERAAVLIGAANHVADCHTALLTVVAEQAPSHQVESRALQQAIEGLMNAAEELKKITDVREGLIRLAVEFRPPTHPEDVGPIQA